MPLCAVLIVFLGCATQPKVPNTLSRDANLEVVSEVTSISDRNAIGLEWKRVDNPDIVGYLIYRGEPGLNLTRVGATDNRFTTHYLDTREINHPHQYVYRVSYFTKDNRESEPSANEIANTPRVIEAISWINSVPKLPRMAKIIFRPHTSERISGYTIERRDRKNTEWKSVARLNGRLHAEYLDKGLADETEYEYRVIAESFDNLHSVPSSIVITVTKPLPPKVTNLTATTDKIGTINIKWKRLANDADGFYRVYASNSDSRGFSVIAELKTTDGANEQIDKAGAERFYKVSFVDEDGLESLVGAPVRGATQAPEVVEKR